MEVLSAELHLIVIAGLDPADIVSLQQTCRHFHDLVEKFGRTIWKDCLNRQCLKNQVFWPTYKDLTEVSEFKSAATAPARFLKAHAHASSRSEALLWAGKKIECQFDEYMHDIFFVPGGRFSSSPPRLGALQCGRWCPMQVWEVLATRVVAAVKICFLLSIGSLDVNQEHQTYQILEIGWSDSDKVFTAMTSPQLHIHDNRISPPPGTLRFLEDGVQLLEGAAVIHHGRGTTVLWDFVSGQYACWNYQQPSPVLGVFTNLSMSHVFYPSHDGFVGVRVPPLQPLGDGPDLLPIPMAETSFRFTSWPHGESYTIKDLITPRVHFVGPELLSPSSYEKHSPLIFQVKANDDPNYAVQLHTYHFLLDEGNPEKSSLKAGDRFYVESRFFGDSFYPEYLRRRPCEGKLATPWMGTFEERLITITPPISTPLASEPCRPQLRTLPLVKFRPQVAEQWKSAIEDFRFTLCPSSGRVLAQGEADVLDPSPLAEFYIYDLL